MLTAVREKEGRLWLQIWLQKRMIHICESVIAFVEDKQQAIRECVRVTKPGGYVGLAVHQGDVRHAAGRDTTDGVWAIHWQEVRK